MSQSPEALASGDAGMEGVQRDQVDGARVDQSLLLGLSLSE